MTALCIAACRRHGVHLPDCPGEDCAGCQPRLAADGLQLCSWHAARLTDDARKAAEVYEALALQLAGGSGQGEKVKRSDDGSPGINAAAADARTTIRATLVSWCRLVAEERGISLPADSIHAIAAYIVRHDAWLAAHPAAGDACDELRELAHGQPYRVAYPGGARRFPIPTLDGRFAACPETVEVDDTPRREPCQGILWTILRPDATLLPSEICCNGEARHTWPASKWAKLGERLATP